MYAFVNPTASNTHRFNRRPHRRRHTPTCSPGLFSESIFFVCTPDHETRHQEPSFSDRYPQHQASEAAGRRHVPAPSARSPLRKLGPPVSTTAAAGDTGGEGRARIRRRAEKRRGCRVSLPPSEAEGRLDSRTLVRGGEWRFPSVQPQANEPPLLPLLRSRRKKVVSTLETAPAPSLSTSPQRPCSPCPPVFRRTNWNSATQWEDLPLLLLCRNESFSCPLAALVRQTCIVRIILFESQYQALFQRTDRIERSPRGSVRPPPGPPPIENLPAVTDPMVVDTGQVSSHVKSTPCTKPGTGKEVLSLHRQSDDKAALLFLSNFGLG